MGYQKENSLFLFFLVLNACSSGSSIFPAVPLVTDTASVVLPNPIGIATDPANSQIILVNSNLDIGYDSGTLMTLSVDATDPTSPVLQVTSVIQTPNFGGPLAFDGANAYVAFRESSSGEEEPDQILRFTVGAGTLAQTASGETGQDPFGVAVSGGVVCVASNQEATIYDADLNLATTIDLTAPDTAGFEDAGSNGVEDIAIDNVSNRLFISNRDGKIFVVDLDNNTISHLMNGPLNTRGITFDGQYIYVVDGNPAALWIFDPSQLTDPASAPEEVDDSSLLVAVIDVGDGPGGIAVDAANARAYVTNTTDRSVSVIDTILFQEIARISLKEEDTGLEEAKDPFGVAVGTFNGVPLVFVTNVESNDISVIHGNALSVVGRFP